MALFGWAEANATRMTVAFSMTRAASLIRRSRSVSNWAERQTERLGAAARLIIEEALGGEAANALGRGYYARGEALGSG